MLRIDQIIFKTQHYGRDVLHLAQDESENGSWFIFKVVSESKPDAIITLTPNLALLELRSAK